MYISILFISFILIAQIIDQSGLLIVIFDGFYKSCLKFQLQFLNIQNIIKIYSSGLISLYQYFFGVLGLFNII